MAAKQTIIFDYGGVLVRTEDYAPRHAWDDRLNLPRGSVERAVHDSESWLQAMAGRLSLADYWADVARQLGLDAADIPRLAADFYAGDRLDTALVAYIQRLRDRGCTVALLSNASPALRGELASLGIAGLFDPLVVSCEIGILKPEPGAYQAVLERAQRPPADAVFIDDMPANIEGAQAVGIHGILYTPGLDLPSLLEPLLAAE